MISKKSRRFVTGCFLIQGMGSFAVSLYFYYLYFLMRQRFGFDNKHNLLLAVLLGFIYVISAWQAGKFAQRCGYFNALKLGIGIMIASWFIGAQLNSIVGLIAASAVLTVGICFLWPTLEALVSEGEDADGLPRAIGTYNVVWAATNALALFTGGTLVEAFGFKSLFYLPLIIAIGQLVLTFWLEKQAAHLSSDSSSPTPTLLVPVSDRPSPQMLKSFVRMAWLANPFAYIAINTLIAVLPGVAAKFKFTPMQAGFACSLWCFVRLGTFVVLWLWTGWHYRFRWLLVSYIALIISFAAILAVPNLAILLAAQICFGAAIGLIYYSSLFYSMDMSDTKGEHGGIHEAAIGIGNCLGPAAGAAALQFLPNVPNGGALAVTLLLTCGLAGLIRLRLKRV